MVHFDTHVFRRTSQICTLPNLIKMRICTYDVMQEAERANVQRYIMVIVEMSTFFVSRLYPRSISSPNPGSKYPIPRRLPNPNPAKPALLSRLT